VSKQTHDDARRAKPALRTVVARHGFLHGMQHAIVGEILDSQQFATVQLPEQRDAGVERLVNQSAAALAHHHDRASAAIAFRATLFGTDRPLLQAQPVEHGRARRKIADAHSAAAPLKLQDVSAHGLAANSA
jgi:hypothetical protein